MVPAPVIPAWVLADVGVCTVCSQNGRGGAKSRIPSRPLEAAWRLLLRLRTFSEFSRHPPLWAGLQEELKFPSIILDIRAWDQPQEHRGHFKMLGVMENFRCALQWRTQ